MMDELDSVLGFNIRLAHGAVLRHFSEHFTDLQLTQKQVSVLWLVSENSGMAQADLALRMQMDRATTMAIVHALEKKGLLARQPSTSDRRRIELMLTPKGTDILEQSHEAIAIHEKWLTDRFTKKELDLLLSFLRRIHGR